MVRRRTPPRGKNGRFRRNPGPEELVFEVVKGALITGAGEFAKDTYKRAKRRAGKRRR